MQITILKKKKLVFMTEDRILVLRDLPVFNVICRTVRLCALSVGTSKGVLQTVKFITLLIDYTVIQFSC